MMATLKSEFRKLLSVRSTYVVSLIALVLIAVVNIYVEGYRGLSGSAASELTKDALAEITLNTITTGSVFMGLVAVLFMIHEYRHNMIMYTLTASNSRTKVLLAKIIVVTTYSLVFSAVCGIFGLGCYYLGLSLRDAALPAQNFDAVSVVGKSLFYNLSYSLLGLLFATIARNIAAALAILFIVPATVEPLLALLLKDNARYLPFAALDKIITPQGEAGFIGGELAVGRAIAVVSAYIVCGWVITWLLFLRRDAT